MIRELIIEDAKPMLEWMHDSEINCWFQQDFGSFDEERVISFIKKSVNRDNDYHDYHFAIESANGEYLGTVSLKNVDTKNYNAEYAICLRKNAIGKGIAYRATLEILDKAFNEFKLNRVYLNVLSNNEKAVRLYERCGFNYEGEWVNHLFINSRYRSLKWYAIQKEDWLLLEKKK